MEGEYRKGSIEVHTQRIDGEGTIVGEGGSIPHVYFLPTNVNKVIVTWQPLVMNGADDIEDRTLPIP